MQCSFVKMSICFLIASIVCFDVVIDDVNAAQLRKTVTSSEQDVKALLHAAWRTASKALPDTPEVTLKHWERYRSTIDASTPMVQFMWYEIAEKAYRELDKHNAAAETSLQMVEIAKRLTPVHRGKAFNLLGISLRHLYAYQLSAASYRCSIAHYPNGHKKLASVYNNLAIVQQRMGNFDSSISLFQQSIRLGQGFIDVPQSTYLLNLAITSSRAGLHENAVGYIKQAMFLETEKTSDQSRLKSLTYLLFSLTEMKDWIQIDRIAREVERRGVLAMGTSTHFLYEWVDMYYRYQRFKEMPPEHVVQALVSGYEQSASNGAHFIYNRIASAMNLALSKAAKPIPKKILPAMRARAIPIIELCGIPDAVQ